METTETTEVQDLINQLLKAINVDSDLSPQRDRVLVREIKEKKSDVLWVPEEGRAGKGVIIASGPGHLSPQGVRIPTELNPGDIVVFNKHTGEEVTFNEEKLRLIKAGDILMRVG
jgi:chaperonin GroES